MPADTVPKAFALGTLWGWLPCGLVYSILFTALLTGNTLSGAAVMLAFGLAMLGLAHVRTKTKGRGAEMLAWLHRAPART